MDLTTRYLTLKLRHPFMPGASPMVDNLDTVRKLEDAGASAIVMRSLFEEEITALQKNLDGTQDHANSNPEARGYTVDPSLFAMGPHEYLEQIRRIKEAVKVPVIASLNGTTLGGWLEHSKLIKQAGADALELNVHRVVTDPFETADSVEQQVMNVLREVKRTVSMPVAVKLSPFYTAMPHMVRELSKAGAQGVVLFNRFYQPDIDVENLDVVRRLHFSTSEELPLRLMWLSILRGRVPVDLCVSGGVHTVVDAVRALMTGATSVQMVSALLTHGPAYLKTIIDGFTQWLVEHEYHSLDQLRGSMALDKCPDPAAYQRSNYIHMLNVPQR
jgi:dihydroorotate dehydrogenase (fumarate)